MKTKFTNAACLKIALQRVLFARLATYISKNAKTLLQCRCTNHFAGENDHYESDLQKLPSILRNAEDFKGFLLPTDLRSKELSLLDVWTKERAFFMATVNRAEILDRFRSSVDQIARGELSVQEARAILRQELDNLKYAPRYAGQAGTIKDLRTVERMNVSLETNLLQVQGYGRYARQQQALDAFPAQRFVRVRMSKVPRNNWQERFEEAVGGDSSGANIEAMTALVNHPCWVRLSVFGTPYPPFDFGSGMGIEPVDRAEAEQLGLLPDGDTKVEEMMTPRDRSLNEGLMSSPRIHDPYMREAIADSLGGLAKWNGNILEFTDPNGTKPYTAEELGEIWSQPIPKKFASLPGKGQMQKQALIDWANDHKEFEEAQSSDRWEDMMRLHQRLKPADEIPASLYRGMKQSAEDIEEFLTKIKKNGYGVRDEYPVESWTKSERSARHYARPHSRNFSIVLEIENPDPNVFKEISPLIRELKHQSLLQKDTNPPITTESEWLFARGTKLKTHSIVRDDEKRIIRINLQSERGTL